MTLGENLQRLRRKAGLSQEEVAGRLFVSRQSVSKWENDQAEPGVDNLKTLAQLYGVSLDGLLGTAPSEQAGPVEQAGPIEQAALTERIAPAEQAAPARDEDRSFYRILFGVRTGLAVLSNLLFSFPAGRINFPFDWIAMLVGLFVPKKWVWGLTVGLEGFNILSGLLALLHLLHGDGIGVVILLQAVVMMAFLFTRKVKAYFGMSENEE